MHLAILMTNTDDSAFAHHHPKDGEKFSRMINAVRPNWRLSVYDATQDIYPNDIATYDGVIITGSPASVHDDAPWVAHLLDQIRTAFAARTPLFGACLGHQAIALALGGRVEMNPQGWGFGCVDMEVAARAPWYDGPATFTQYAAHKEQVTQLPDGAETIFTAPNCPQAGFAIANLVYTTQNHPEMTPQFFAALVEELGAEMPPQVTQDARASLTRQADMQQFAQSVAQFFESGSAG